MPDHSSRFSFAQKIRPGHLAVNGALKTIYVFTAARSLQSRSYAAGGARYLQADLMLLTHAGCAFKDPRGRFGISYPAAVLRTEQSTAREVKSDRTRMANAVLQHITCMDGCVSPLRTAALRSNRRYGAAALLHCGAKVPQILHPKRRRMLTCTGRPDGSGARSGRLQLPGCVRTAP